MQSIDCIQTAHANVPRQLAYETVEALNTPALIFTNFSLFSGSLDYSTYAE